MPPPASGRETEPAAAAAATSGTGDCPALSSAERAWIIALLGVVLALRVYYAFIFRIDSDEPQHLHVVWGWANGLLQYRDVFDNHAPLFQMLCAPLFKMFGERADIIIPMRIAMTAFCALSLWSVWKIGASLFSPRTGAWAALFAGAQTTFFYTSTEFRTDDMWAAMWLLTLAVLVGGRLTAGRLFAVGFLLGTTFSVSMKTSLLAISLLTSVVMTLAIKWQRHGWRVEWRRVLAGVAALLGGMVILPAALIGFFASHEALAAMRYCVIDHNIVPRLKRWGHLHEHLVIAAVAFPAMIAAGVALFRVNDGPQPRARQFWRVAIFLTPLVFITLLYCFWPDITREDFLPFSPLLMVGAVTPGVLFCFDKMLARAGRDAGGSPLRWLLPAAFALVEIGMIVTKTKPWHNDARRDIAAYAEVLNLTHPGEYVMDGKAGAIYRPRPFYYVLETITRARMKMRLIPDDVIERLIATRTAVASLSGILTQSKSARFIRANYLSLAGENTKVRVLGKLLEHPTAAQPVRFEVSIPARYQIVTESGAPAGGILDGEPLTGARELGAGTHTFQPDAVSASTRLALLWERAREKGYRPRFKETD